MYVTLRGRGDKERTVPVPEVALAAVERALQVDPPDSADAWVFRNAAGTMLSYDSRSRLFRRCKKAAGLPLGTYGPHVLRRTFGTMVVESGERSLAWLSQFIGHDDFSPTTTYVRPGRAWTQSQIRKLDPYLERL